MLPARKADFCLQYTAINQGEWGSGEHRRGSEREDDFAFWP